MPEAWITLAVLALTLLALVLELGEIEIVVTGALTVLMVLGVIEPADALGGFGSIAVITIGALLVVAAGVRRTGLLDMVADRLLGRGEDRAALLRMMVPAGALSAFLNNTPIVAMFVPVVLDWCKRNGRAPSRMLMPLSFATILGGLCTLIGTSSTLVIDGLLRDHGNPGFGMFELAWVGVPLTVVGFGVIWGLSGLVLPDRRDPMTGLMEERREFLVEMLVDADSPLVGQTIADGGLRNLPGLFLMGLERGGHFMSPVKPVEPLAAHDRLVFTGVASTVVDLRRFTGLSPAPDTHYDPEAAERRSHIFEAVVASSSPLVGTTIKDFGFRSRYDAAVIAVHRAGQRLATKLGEVEMRAGDTLMIEASPRFAKRWGDSTHFSLVSRTYEEHAPRRSKARWALLVLGGLVVVVTAGWLPMVVAALVAAGVMVAGGLVPGSEVPKAVQLPILITIASAIGLGRALEASGAASMLAQPIEVAGHLLGPVGVLAGCFVFTSVFASMVGNVAAAAILFPVAFTAAAQVGVDPRGLAVAIAVAATTSFVTPTGYQTNLMVYGPGGYRFTDFARLGAPLLIVVFVITLVVIPRIWPLVP